MDRRRGRRRRSHSEYFPLQVDPPASGAVVFYVIGMGANGSGGPEPNERVYANTYKLTLTPPAPVAPVKPTFSPSGVLSAAAKVPGLTPGGLVAIYGQNLSQTTSDWSGLDFSSGKLPTKLGDVTVTVDDKPAAVYSVSPTKIEIQAPDDTARGPVRVVVRRGAVASDPVVVNMTSVRRPSLLSMAGTLPPHMPTTRRLR